MSKNLDEIRNEALTQWQAMENSGKPLIRVGTATCGRSAGSLDTMAAFNQELEAQEMEGKVLEVGCVGLCYAEPLVTISKPSRPEVVFSGVDAKRAVELVEGYLKNGEELPDYAMGSLGEETLEGLPKLFDLPVLKPQVRRVLGRCGTIDPSNVGHYLANGGYSGLEKALSMTPEQVIEEMKASGLRGRGGAGFPAWRKWLFCREAKGAPKYLICNADEGDPGAFMNRSLLEGDPHALIEGMLCAAYAIGASHGYIYCRAEYPLALERLDLAIKQAKEMGALGDNVLGTDFSFHLKVKEGAGAFVCGEETALIASIEGERGMPRPRPPFPAVCGLWGKPTIINNVETLASVALIMQRGAGWFAECGSELSKGTKTFALVGKVKNTGLAEVPMGTTLREMICDIGGGVLDEGKQLKAVQTGGPSGGCIPYALFDTPVDYDSLQAVGSIMGSGGIVVLDEETCMVDFARYFLDFAEKESCGECVPCRLGTKQLLDILEDICAGKGRPGDIELLEELAQGIKMGALCGLGQTAPNPVLTTIKYFREEYEAHIKDHKCPAKVCRPLLTFSIDPETCTGCMLCARNCPEKAITGVKKEVHVLDQEKCIQCGLCAEQCRFGSVIVE